MTPARHRLVSSLAICLLEDDCMVSQQTHLNVSFDFFLSFFFLKRVLEFLGIFFVDVLFFPFISF